MPYRIDEGGWFSRWRVSDSPETWQLTAARKWLDGLAHDPEQSPSRESERHHPHSQDKLRGAFLMSAEAFVVYAVDDTTETVRVVHLGRFPPPEMEFRLP